MSEKPTHRASPEREQTFWRTIDLAMLVLLAVLAWWLGLFDRSPIIIVAYFVATFSLMHNLLLWGVIPFVRQRQISFSASPEYVPFDPHDPDLPRTIPTSIQRASQALQPHGFQVVAHIWSVVHGSRISDFVTIFDNAATGDFALLSLAFSGDVVEPDKITRTFNFFSVFADGTVIFTGQGESPSILPRRRGWLGFGFASVRDPGERYRLHRRLVARFGTGRQQIPLLKDAAVSYFRGMNTDLMERLAEDGYAYHDAAHGVYRLTIRGVYFVLWRLRWPMREFFKAITQRKTARLLRDLRDVPDPTEDKPPES